MSKQENKKKIVHLINDIAIGGGAQKMLYNITKYADLNKFEISVISLLPLDDYKEGLEKNGMKVIVMNIKKHPFKTIRNIINILKQTDTLFCWMYASNLVGYFCGKLAKVKKINMGIRQSNVGKDVLKPTTRLINRIGALASHSKYITNVIYNGEKAKIVHEALGYDKSKSSIIINGCETDKFKYNPKARKQILAENKNLRDDAIWIISATRYNKIKDVPNFVNAIERVKKQIDNIQIFMCGNGFTKENKELVQLIQKNNLLIDKDIFLRGLVNNLPDMFSACDLYVLHSAGEAFPNTLLEAMSCEIECIATDAGDTRKIHPNKNNIVPIRNAQKLSEKIIEVLLQGRPKKRKDYREHVIKEYSIINVVKEYEKYY